MSDNEIAHHPSVLGASFLAVPAEYLAVVHYALSWKAQLDGFLLSYLASHALEGVGSAVIH